MSPDVHHANAATTQKHLPLRPAFFHLLLGLSQGDAHGYALKLAAEERTGGALKIGPGTLYESLQRLEKRGLVTPVPPPADALAERKDRRYLRITPLGIAVLRAELQNLERALIEARKVPLLLIPT